MRASLLNKGRDGRLAFDDVYVHHRSAAVNRQCLRKMTGRRRVHGFSICGAFMLLGAILSVVVQSGRGRVVAVYVCLIAAVWGVAGAQQRQPGIQSGKQQGR